MAEARDKPAAKGRPEARPARTRAARRSKQRPAQAEAGEARPDAPKLNVDGYAPRLQKHYEEVVRPKLIEEFGYRNPMQVPAIEKVVLNMGVGEAIADSRRSTAAAADLALIAGQKPWSPRRASRSPPSRCARTCRSAPR